MYRACACRHVLNCGHVLTVIYTVLHTAVFHFEAVHFLTFIQGWLSRDVNANIEDGAICRHSRGRNGFLLQQEGVGVRHQPGGLYTAQEE